ncbi:MAG: pyridoxamine 5'-phosphate oxidase family protein [Candidatus Dormibacteraeota bacterium]|nr:pyridoxamine 5'-phosphate oxidase family protein [Candidatus Dormibacteraeota bacterium]
MTTTYPVTPRTRVRRHSERGSYDRELVHSILDGGMIAHVGVGTDRGPRVIPMMYARDGDTLYLHGAPANQVLNRAASGVDVCVEVTLLDGLVLARSAFNHSMNYRSVVVYGQATPVTDDTEKLRALDVLVRRITPDRADIVRAPNAAELAGTRLLALPLSEVSAKVRSGPPKDDPADMDWPVWTGVIPLIVVQGEPQPAE